ncbi:glutathione S-transferase [Agaricicola taiwanensis]|uniref:Glutathione S-transferase n=1 Tax=Agaricicola taiwanensis TaxID=591372 RepID=A0A8J3DX76_9RHOB|nr:glutathione S-transferase family protein [Agaricicola taiwanensis]GGE47931.1 glutathione S-transferase [Agaricicola taiwanensis]
MLTIYGVYRSRASRAFWLARELNLQFRHVPVIQAYKLDNPHAPDAPLNTRTPEFLSINPNGHVPSIDDDGMILHESMAINLHLARKHGGPLAPAGLEEEALMTMWSFWALTEVEGQALVVQNNAGKNPEKVQAAVEALRRPFSVLNDALAKDGYAVGGRFTVADINLAEVVRYASSATALFDGAPHVKAWLSACHERPAFREVWAKREAEPL